jgi:hypothetical protein
MTDPIRLLDVAHPPRHPGLVEEDLTKALADIRKVPAPGILKIIHGYGSSGRGGSTKEVVRNWLFRQKRLRAVIEGERYGVLDPDTMKMRDEVGRLQDPDLDGANPGITIVWIK